MYLIIVEENFLLRFYYLLYEIRNILADMILWHCGESDKVPKRKTLEKKRFHRRSFGIDCAYINNITAWYEALYNVTPYTLYRDSTLKPRIVNERWLIKRVDHNIIRILTIYWSDPNGRHCHYINMVLRSSLNNPTLPY